MASLCEVVIVEGLGLFRRVKKYLCPIMHDPKGEQRASGFQIFLVQLSLHRMSAALLWEVLALWSWKMKTLCPEVKLIPPSSGHTFLIPVIVKAYDKHTGPVALIL